ncbi:MAG: AraC family transcriptional regulator [Tannerella sp.]|jgi:AraC-like DNA-binding protein|nr:AraC family transcriptional regulator [Tannerella sp.]
MNRDKSINLSFARLKEYFWYGETDLAIFRDYPCRLEGGVAFFCIAGKATLCYGVGEHRITQNTESFLLPGMTFYMKNMSDDFSVRLFTFSGELFDDVNVGLDFSVNEYLRRVPFYTYTEKNAAYMSETFTWYDMAKLLSKNTGSKSFPLMQRNFLQSYLTYLFECIRLKLDSESLKLTRKRELFYQFMSLLSKHCREQRNVRFYAEKLHITTNYLCKITRESIPCKSPKDLIDQHFILEIKTLLQSPKLSISEISCRLDFPNESYFCRYFRRLVGMSPQSYRMTKINRYQ